MIVAPLYRCVVLPAPNASLQLVHCTAPSPSQNYHCHIASTRCSCRLTQSTRLGIPNHRAAPCSVQVCPRGDGGVCQSVQTPSKRCSSKAGCGNGGQGSEDDRRRQEDSTCRRETRGAFKHCSWHWVANGALTHCCPPFMSRAGSSSNCASKGQRNGGRATKVDDGDCIRRRARSGIYSLRGARLQILRPRWRWPYGLGRGRAGRVPAEAVQAA